MSLDPLIASVTAHAAARGAPMRRAYPDLIARERDHGPSRARPVDDAEHGASAMLAGAGL